MKASLFAAPLAAAIASAALSITAIANSPAIAASNAEVRIGDLDLSTEAGRAELSRRVDIAASKVCRPEAITGSHIAHRSQIEQCKAELQRQIESRVAIRQSTASRGR